MSKREKFLRTSEVASKLQVSPKTIARWAKEGRLPYLATLGGHRRFPESAIEHLIENLSTMGPTVNLEDLDTEEGVSATSGSYPDPNGRARSGH